jgi:hypothetical protein
MHTVRSQRGVSLIGGLVVLTVITFVVIAGARVGPHYMDFWAIRKAMDKAATDPAAKVDGAESYVEYVGRSLQVNNIRDLDLKKALNITEQKGGLTAHLAYEKREHLAGNIDLVVSFDHQTGVHTQ